MNSTKIGEKVSQNLQFSGTKNFRMHLITLAQGNLFTYFFCYALYKSFDSRGVRRLSVIILPVIYSELPRTRPRYLKFDTLQILPRKK